MKNFITFLIKLIYPDRCGFCGCIIPENTKYQLCDICVESIRFIGENSCKKCGKSLLYGYDEMCADCRTVEHNFDRAYSVAEYRDELKRALIRYKFFGKRQLKNTFAGMLSDKVSDIPLVDMVMAVPLHEQKLRERGFNQSEDIAKEVAKRCAVIYEGGALKRIRYTGSQSTLSRKKRLKNLCRAFEVPEKSRVEGKSILLVDDIYTTGSTVSECAKALKYSGASKVYVLTVASGKGY